MSVDQQAAVEMVRRSGQQGVPVITVDSGVDSNAPYAYIATDNIGAARLAADTLAGLIGSKGVVGDIAARDRAG